MSTITAQQVQAVATLAHIPVSEAQAESISAAFETTLAEVENLQQLDTNTTEPTHQVTGLENVLRDDVVTTTHGFTQEEALANAPDQHEGYFVVSRILDND